MTDRPPPDHVAAYDTQAFGLADEYDRIDPSVLHAGFADLLSSGADRLALDVGAGSGRDAAWLDRLGFDVVAVEPADAMRAEGRRRCASQDVRWLDDRLPSLDAVHALGLAFDLVLLSAVWQHVAPGDRRRAFRKLTALLRPGGLLVVTLRSGPAPRDRPMHAVTLGEVEALARDHGLAVSRVLAAPDLGGRERVGWTTVVMTLPDDGAGALPLLRGIILNDDKSATYKLGLLRAVARMADLTPNLAVPHPVEDAVTIPLGAVALNWIRMYLPLVERRLPQMPGNAGPDGLGFAKRGFRDLLADGTAPVDLRVGAVFSGERAASVAAALSEASRTIAGMPANYIRYPNSVERVFDASLARALRRPGLVLDAETLAAFGSVTVPGHVWRAMQRLGVWIEPVLTAEWTRLVRGYMDRQGRSVPPGEIEAALAWIEPRRDVRIAREAALTMLGRGEVLRCVWSERRLTAATLDVDHCLPWSAWPCGDLWNLMPAHRTTNQRDKRDLLPSTDALLRARAAITSWWDEAWRRDDALSGRFAREAGASLPLEGAVTTASVFEGLAWRRLRLRQDQQVAEWAGHRVG